MAGKTTNKSTKKSSGKKNKLSTSTLLTALLYIVIGVLFIVFKGELLNWGLTIAGILAIAYGIFLVIKKALIPGIIYIAVGILLIWGGWRFLDIVLLVLGIVLIIYGALGIFDAIRKKRGVLALILSALTIVAGVLFVVNRWAAVDWILIICGVVLIVDGIIGLVKAISKK